MNDEARRRAERVRRVFGAVLPDTTGDEQPEQPERPDEHDAEHDAERDEWYRQNRPPHHDSPS